MTVARYLEEPHSNSSRGKEETKPREEEKAESLPDLPLLEEEKKSPILNATTTMVQSATKQEMTHPKGSNGEATRKVTNV